MKIAVEGCAHGELEKIYETIQSIEAQQNIKVDLLLCCGDFQATRNVSDLQTMAVPRKYLDICTFYKYYSGELVAPILTIFVGGNHEASNYLQELPYGGWVAPNIYYLGNAGVVQVNGIRIAGISGIQKDHDYLRGHFEYTPYTENTKRSVYHVRQLEVFRLKQLSGNIDIFMSHDWPRGIYDYGNKAQLLRYKPHFREDIENERLGSKPCMELLRFLKPNYWFAAHLHCKFSALVPHDDTNNGNKAQVTKFLALDKCLPRRQFLQIQDIDTPDYISDVELKFEYDLEWLTILHLTNHLLSVKQTNHYMPGPSGFGERYNFTPTEEEKQQLVKKLEENLIIPNNFCRTVEPYNPRDMEKYYGNTQPKAFINPQLTCFCDLLGLDDPVSLAMLMSGQELNHSSDLDASQLDNESILEPSICVSPNTSSINESLEISVNELEFNKSVFDEHDKSYELKRLTPNPKSPTETTTSNSDTRADLKRLSPQDATPKTSGCLNDDTPVRKFRRRNQEMYQTEPVDYN